MEERELMMCGRGRRGGDTGIYISSVFYQQIQVKIKIVVVGWWVVVKYTMELLASFSIYSPSAKNEVDFFTVH